MNFIFTDEWVLINLFAKVYATTNSLMTSWKHENVGNQVF